MSSGWIKTGIAAGLLTAGFMSAETLYEQDGITLEGSVRLVHHNAAICQVLAESESPETYEATKPNHGQPLHVWRLDYGVLNGSGQALSDVTAHFQIEAQWPPCTSWTGLDQYPGPVQWAGSFETIQRPSGMQPGEEAAATAYVLAFDGQQPQFGRRQVTYRFGDAAPQAAETAPLTEPLVPFLPEPLCIGRPEGTQCWIELANQPGCYLWDEYYDPGVDAPRWNGGCSDGLANGTGTVTWQLNGRSVRLTGPVRNGKHHGCTAVSPSDDWDEKGRYVDGQRQGRWDWYDETGRHTGSVVFKDGELVAPYPDPEPPNPC